MRTVLRALHIVFINEQPENLILRALHIVFINEQPENLILRAFPDFFAMS